MQMAKETVEGYSSVFGLGRGSEKGWSAEEVIPLTEEAPCREGTRPRAT